MTTSLAEQLKKLAVPQTTLLSTQDKKRDSFLFDPKEAASFSKEIFYQIGLDGLEELKKINQAFAQFENNLFSVTSKDFERSVHTEESNKKLDKVIRRFLLHLSPYFLINSAHKAVEWLIYRYRIHQYNREDFLMLILPYHETNLFVRALQLIKIRDENDNLFWLKSLQKPGVHLPKSSLLNHAASSPHFLKFITKFVLAMVKEHDKPSTLTLAFNFYCVVITGAIERSAAVSEIQISYIIPGLLKALQSDIPDFCACAFVIIARLVSKTQLSEKILEVLVEKITSLDIPSLKTEEVLLLIVLYQSQSQFQSVGGSAVRNLMELEWFGVVLEELNRNGSCVEVLLKPLFNSAISMAYKENDQKVKAFVEKLLDDIKLGDGLVSVVVTIILDVFSPKQRTQDHSDENKLWLSSLLQILEKQYPSAFDEEMNKILKRSPGSKENQHQKSLRKLLQNPLDIENTFCIFEKLYHPNPQFRKQAIKHLIKNYESLKDRQKEQIKRCFLDRINDDNPDVVRETLGISRKILPEIIEKDVLKQNLVRLINHIRTEDSWNNILLPVLKVLCSHFESNDVEIFITILPYLLPTTDGEFYAAKLIAHSTYAHNCDFLRPILPQLMESKNHKSFFDAMYPSFGNIRRMFSLQTFIEGIRSIDNSSVLTKYLSVTLLSNFLQDNTNTEVSALILEIFLFHFNNCKMVSLGTDSQGNKLIACAKQNKFPLEGFLGVLQAVILKTEKPKINLGKLDFLIESATSNLLRMLFEILFKAKQQVFYEIIDVCLMHICPDVLERLELLINFCAVPESIVEDSVKLKCMHYVLILLGQTDKGAKERIVNFESNIISYLLSVSYNSNQSYRKIVLEILETLAKIRSSYAKMFLRGLLNQKEEFLMDHEQIPTVIRNTLFDDEKSDDQKIKFILKTLVTIASDETIPLYIVARVSNILSAINSLEIFEETAKLASKLLNVVRPNCEAQISIILQRNISRFDNIVAENLNLSSNIWKFLTLALKKEDLQISLYDGVTCPTVSVLNQVNRDLFDTLNNEVKPVFLDYVIELATVTKNPEVLASSSRIFKHIDLNVALVMEQLKKMRDAQSEKNKTPRRRRVVVVPTADILELLDWKKGLTVLEFIQNKKKMKNIEDLPPVLFDILKKCLDFDEQASVEYPKQLILSSLLHCCEKITDNKLLEKVVNVELIVQCIRASQNPQTHHHALLLLALVASLVPTQVLHHIMAIFTFMGSSVLRHDDAYSFQIITKIIDNVIPVLIKGGKTVEIAKVLRVFVDVILDVPEHRRMPLYKQLLERIGGKENLYLFLLLVFESHVVHGHADKQRMNKTLEKFEAAPKRLDIAANLAREFSADTVIISCIKVIEYLNSLPVDKDDSLRVDGECPTFNIMYHTPKQFRHYKYTIVVFTSTLLSSQEFVSKVAALPDEELLKLESHYKDLIVNILTYIQNTSKIADKNLNTPQAQFWKAMLHYSYEILDSVNALLTPQMFLLVIKGLMQHNLNNIRKRALELLNTKLQSTIEFFEECSEAELYGLIPPLIDRIKVIESDDFGPEQEVIIQTALLSLKLLIKHLAPNEPEKFTAILTFVTNLMKLAKSNENILASVILCLAELCATLRAHAIPGLAKYMPAILKALKSRRKEEKPSLLLLCIITAIQKFVDSLPLFLSPYLEKMLCEVCYFACKYQCEEDDQKVAPIVTKLKSIKQKIGSAIPARVLIPAIEQGYNTLLEKMHYDSVGALMDILGECLKNLKPTEVQAVLPELTTFFLNALQFRSDGKASDDDINTVERHLVKAMTVLVLKLSETTFRPLYYRLFDWAVRSSEKSERIITFYCLSSGIAECLKSLFVLFAGHFVNNAATVLDACNQIKNEQLYFEEEPKNVVLIENVLKTLHFVFLYDTQSFVNKERFEVLMQPIVDQLENTIGGIEKLQERSKTILIPCIVNFAVATGNDALWKQMNYQILLKMRHSSPEIRLIALDCLSEVAKKLGEDFLPLLPETIPFLAELLEDEEESVEKACQKAVQELEKVLGEPLKKYF